MIAAAVAIPVFAIGGGSGNSDALAGVDGNAIGAIDAASGQIAHWIPVAGPGVGRGRRGLYLGDERQ